MNLIHPTAIVHGDAQLGKNIHVGPYCIVGPHVFLEDNVTLHSHVVIQGKTHVGAATQIYPFASLGLAPQHHHAEESATGSIYIGKQVVIREHVTINLGMHARSHYTTRIGDHSCLFIGAHVGHDVIVGKHVTIINNVLLGGHVCIDDYAVISGGAAIHPFCIVGRYAFVGGLTGVTRHIMPYAYAFGSPAYLKGLNIVGIRRHGISKGALQALRHTYKRIFFGKDGLFDDRLQEMADLYEEIPEIEEVISFIKDRVENRSVCHPRYRYVEEDSELKKKEAYEEIVYRNTLHSQ